MATTTATSSAQSQQLKPAEPVVMPTLLGIGYGNYNAQPDNFILSFLVHTLGLFLIVVGTHWMIQNTPKLKQNVIPIFMGDNIVLSPSNKDAGGGGGGGDLDKILASKGKPPKFDMNQIVPPTAIIKNPDPKLAVDQSIMVPDIVHMPTSQTQVGDPLSAALVLSNGTGMAGIGSGKGGGVGSGSGRGLGPGFDAGVGGNIFRVGAGVSPPKPIYSPDPDYSDEARKVKYQGTVILHLIIDANGNPRDIRVARGIGLGLDEKAVEKVRTWRFEPAKKDGHAVAVAINVEVNFNLY
jgi:protein TonB